MRLILAAFACLALGALIGVSAARQELAADPGMGDLESGDGARSKEVVGPRIVVEGGETYDFGSMEYPGNGKHEFVVRNEGNAPLILTPGKETCRCTISDIADKTVAPGGKTTLTLTWKPKPDDELFSNGVDVETNDPARRSIRFRAVGRVVRALRWFPEAFAMSNVTATEGGKGTLRLYGFVTDALQIAKYEFTKAETAKYFSLETRPLKQEELEDKKARSGLELTVIAARGLPLGAIDQELQVLTNLDDAQPVSLPVRGQVGSDISLIGSKVVSDQNLISFGTIPHGEGAKMSGFFLVKGPHRNDVQFKIKSVDPADVLQVKLDPPLGQGTQVVRHALHVEIPKDAPPTIRLGTDVAPYGEIVVETTHPDVPQITIKVRFAIE